MHLANAVAAQAGGVAPSMMLVAVVFYPQLDALVRTMLPTPGVESAHASVLVRFAQLIWLYIGHLRYELPCLFADTIGQIFHFFPKGFYAEVEPYTREAREKRNDQVLLRLQRTKSEVEKMRIEEIHPEVLRRVIARIERWQWRHARLGFLDNLITSDDGRKAKRRFAFLARATLETLRARLAETEAFWIKADTETRAKEEGASAPASASSRARSRGTKAIAKPRSKLERPSKRPRPP